MSDFITSPGQLVEKLAGWKNLEPEQCYYLVLAACEMQFTDLEQRENLQRSLLAVARNLASCDNERYQPVLWAALRRYASLIDDKSTLIPENPENPWLGEFLEPDKPPLTQLAALQCIQSLFADAPPTKPNSFNGLLENVNRLAAHCFLSNMPEPRTPEPGQDAALALNTLGALVILGGEIPPNISKAPMETWFTELAYGHLQEIRDCWQDSKSAPLPAVQQLDNTLSNLSETITV